MRFDGALCYGSNTEVFFPKSGQSAKRKEGKEICNGTDGRAACPALDACFDYAIGEPSVVGTWGGTTAPERARIRRSRKLKALT